MMMEEIKDFSRANPERVDAASLRCTKERHVKVFDTTLRDGQQCPGAGMSFDKNIQYARLAAGLRVDIIEAGFPSASNADFEIVRAIAEEVKDADFVPTIAALCQLREEQVIRTIESLSPLVAMKKARVHTYVPVDPELMPASLGRNADDKTAIVNEVYRLIAMAVGAGMEVQFSPEGYSRMRENFHFVTDIIRAAVSAGATIINCPDTIGGASSLEGPEYFVEKMNRHARIIESEFPDRDITWSVHCHNDFGLAVTNTINAVFHGPARQIEGCINGIGERAGNASLEQCIMIIKHFGQNSNPQIPLHTIAQTEKIQSISDFVGIHMLPRQPHWPVSGDNAARHSSGGHTNAILKNPLAYQPFDPGEIGKNITMLFGPLSGGNHAKSIIEGRGYRCQDSEKAAIAQFIKDKYSERRKGITDDELMKAYFEFRSPIAVERIDYAKSSNKSVVTMHGRFFSRDGEVKEEYIGRDSALAAVKKAIECEFESVRILSHRSRSDSPGIDANSVSTIVLSLADGHQVEGTGIDQDIEVSAIRALIDAANRAYIDRNFSLGSIVNQVESSVKARSVTLSAAC